MTAKAKILVVEDEAIVAADIAASLEEMGYDLASVAYTGEDAVRLVEAEKPDLVLMDIMLGSGINGIEAAEAMKKKGNVPVIFITAYSDEDILNKAKLTEPSSYIVKPISSRDLRISIEMALYRHKMESEREQILKDLREALSQIKTLKGLLPICAWCKKIRNDRGYWNSLEQYLEEHTDATFTHGICPDCLRKAEKEEFGDEK